MRAERGRPRSLYPYIFKGNDMNRLLTGIISTLLLVGASAASAAPADDACTALMDARSNLVTMLGSSDKAQLDNLKTKVHAASDKVDAILAAMQHGYNAADTAKASEFKPVWDQFKNTRETEIIPAVYAGKNADAKAIAGGIQAERMKKMKAVMGCK